MIDRLLNFMYHPTTPDGLYEKVSAIPKYVTDPKENVDSYEVSFLKQIIKEKGHMPSPEVYRGKYLTCSNPRKPHLIIWVYFYIPESNAFPIVINNHQARNLFKREEYEKENLLEHPNEVTKTLIAQSKEKREALYLCSACIGRRHAFSYFPFQKTMNYFIVKGKIDKDGNCKFSYPLFIKPVEQKDVKENPEKYSAIIDRYF